MVSENELNSISPALLIVPEPLISGVPEMDDHEKDPPRSIIKSEFRVILS